MGPIRGQENKVSDFNAEWFVIDRDLHLAFRHLDQSIKRCGVFAQRLLFIEGEQGYGASLATEKNPAYDRTVLIVDQIRQ